MSKTLLLLRDTTLDNEFFQLDYQTLKLQEFCRANDITDYEFRMEPLKDLMPQIYDSQYSRILVTRWHRLGLFSREASAFVRRLQLQEIEINAVEQQVVLEGLKLPIFLKLYFTEGDFWINRELGLTDEP